MPRHNKDKSLQKLLDITNLFIDAKDNNGNTPLLLATSKNHYSTVKLLLKNDAFINATNNQGEIALHRAVYNQDKSLIDLLLEYGADASLKANNGKTAYDIAQELQLTMILPALLVVMNCDMV
jgi:ankyrin repeat protein